LVSAFSQWGNNGKATRCPTQRQFAGTREGKSHLLFQRRVRWERAVAGDADPEAERNGPGAKITILGTHHFGGC
jgi:hypothetical protein